MKFNTEIIILFFFFVSFSSFSDVFTLYWLSDPHFRYRNEIGARGESAASYFMVP